MQRIKVKKLIRTIGCCPTQLEGETEDGKFIYIHYRYGTIEVYVSPNEDDFIDHLVFRKVIGDHYDGYLTERRLREVLDFIDFPDRIEYVGKWDDDEE